MAELAKTYRSPAARKKGLALTLRSMMPDEIVAEMLIVAQMGVCPMLVRDNRRALGFRVDRGIAITSELQRAWFTDMVNRAYGAPAQHQSLEVEVQGQMSVLHAAIDPQLVREVFDSGNGLALRDALRQALTTPKTPTQAAVPTRTRGAVGQALAAASEVTVVDDRDE